MSRSKSLLVLLALVALAVPAAAQGCFGDDGFNVPGACCVPTQPNLPPFPPMTVQSRGACFRGCTVEQVFNVNINLGAPIPIFCDVYAIPMTITGTVTTVNTFLVAKYHRTWTEFPGPAGQRQVWRFLVNTDVRYVNVAAAQIPCPVPTCVAAGLPVHFTGSVDYALDCLNNSFQVAINLTHLCGLYSHGPLSVRPTPAGFEHRERSYAFVGPAPFNFALATVPQGAITEDMQRSTEANISVFPALWRCYSENTVFQGQLTSVQQSCPCPDPNLPVVQLRWTDQQLNFNYGCDPTIPPANFNSIGFAGFLPTGLSALSLGTYGGPIGQYPSGEQICVYIGIATADDPCGFNIPIHVVTGVGTFGGDAAMLFPTPQNPNGVFVRQFVDLENVLVVQPSNPPQLSIGYGAAFLSTMNWGLNPM